MCTFWSVKYGRSHFYDAFVVVFCSANLLRQIGEPSQIISSVFTDKSSVTMKQMSCHNKFVVLVLFGALCNCVHVVNACDEGCYKDRACVFLDDDECREVVVICYNVFVIQASPTAGKNASPARRSIAQTFPTLMLVIASRTASGLACPPILLPSLAHPVNEPGPVVSSATVNAQTLTIAP